MLQNDCFEKSIPVYSAWCRCAVLSIFMISIKKSYPYLEVGNKTNRAMHKKIADEY